MVLPWKHQKSYLIFACLALLIITSNVALMKTEIYPVVTPPMALASFIDLTLVLPFLCYLFVVRKRRSAVTLLPVLLFGFWIAYFIVPHSKMPFFDFIKYSVYGVEALFILAELFLAVYLVRKIPGFVSNYRKFKKTEFFFPVILRKTLYKTFGQKRMADVLVTDFSAFHYGLFSWRKKPAAPDRAVVFSYHKNTDFFGLFIMMVHAMAIEVIALHFVMLLVSELAAWIVTALDLYALLWIIAYYQAVRLCPVIVDNRRIAIQKGTTASVEIPLSYIASLGKVPSSNKRLKKEKNAFFLTLPGFIEEPPQFVIQLQTPVTVHYPFWVKKEVTKLYFTVDEKHRFYETVSERING